MLGPVAGPGSALGIERSVAGAARTAGPGAVSDGVLVDEAVDGG